MIYDGSVRDTTNFCSDEYIAINSCNIQKSAGKSYTVIRNMGRVDYHVLYVAKGECTCWYNNAQTLLTRGDFVLYPPGIKQTYSFKEGVNAKSLWVHFSGFGVKGILQKLGLEGGVYHSLVANAVEECFESMIYEHSVNSVKGRVAATGELMKLLSLLSENHEELGIRANSDIVVKILQYLHANWQKPISVAEVAKKVCLSESRTAHIFRSSVGKSIHQYILGLRIASAKELLSGTDLSISEIGEMVGFHDPLYFSRVFKSAVGQSPKAYRTTP